MRGRPVISAVICSRYERVTPIGARSLCCCPSIQSTSGIPLVVLVEGDSWVGEKMGDKGCSEHVDNCSVIETGNNKLSVERGLCLQKDVVRGRVLCDL